MVLYPIQFGLLWLGRKRTGRYSLRGVLHYLDKPIPRGKIAAIGHRPHRVDDWWCRSRSLPLDNFVFDAFFTWIPFEGAGASATTYLDGLLARSR